MKTLLPLRNEEEAVLLEEGNKDLETIHENLPSEK